MRLISMAFLFGAFILSVGCSNQSTTSARSGGNDPSDSRSAEENAVEFVEKMGGRIERDDRADGKPVAKVVLEDSKVTDAGLRELAGFKQLQSLNLNGTEVTDRGMMELVGFKQLQSLTLWGTGVTDDGVNDLIVLK